MGNGSYALQSSWSNDTNRCDISHPIVTGSSTLTVFVSSSVAMGTYTVTVTGTEGSATHSATVTVTVTAAGGGGITNGGFETGTFSGWSLK
jgi:Flp pilus assembly protein TadG